MEKSPNTLSRIAEALQLSRTTVSVCLSGNTRKGRIKPETVERVKAYAAKINYIPNRIAQSLKKPGDSPVGLLIRQDSSLEKSLYALRRAMSMLDESGREFIVQNFLKFHISDAVAALKGMNVKEMIMFGTFDENINVNRVAKNQLAKFDTDLARLVSLLQDINFYAVDYSFPMPDDSKLEIYRLGISRSKVYTQLFTSLFKTGRSPFVCDENCLSHGIVENLAKAGYAIKQEHILAMPDGPVDDLFKTGHELASKVIPLIKADQVKTVVLHNDDVATGLISELQGNGYSVPDDISVVGFNNTAASKYFKIPLTTIGLPIMENTIMAVNAILKKEEIPKTLESESKIIWRDSARV